MPYPAAWIALALFLGGCVHASPIAGYTASWTGPEDPVDARPGSDLPSARAAADMPRDPVVYVQAMAALRAGRAFSWCEPAP